VGATLGADRFAIVYRVVERCQREGLLRGERDGCGRVYTLTPAGRRRLRERREFGGSVARLLAASR
jgi:DNA-binding PadR family transcriptional regulator